MIFSVYDDIARVCAVDGPHTAHVSGEMEYCTDSSNSWLAIGFITEITKNDIASRGKIDIVGRIDIKNAYAAIRKIMTQAASNMAALTKRSSICAGLTYIFRPTMKPFPPVIRTGASSLNMVRQTM